MLKKLFSIKPSHITLEGSEFAIKYVIRKNMRRALLRIEEPFVVNISLSRRNFIDISNFLKSNKEWILEQNAKVKKRFEEGSLLHFRGDAYIIRHHEGKLAFKENYIYINLNKAKKQIDTLYKVDAKNYIIGRVDFYKRLMDLEFSRVRFHCTKRKWGSCNSKGVITFNPYMMKLTDEMIDYIIVHELTHLEHLNHSKKFYALLERYMPNYKTIQKEIDIFSSKIEN